MQQRHSLKVEGEGTGGGGEARDRDAQVLLAGPTSCRCSLHGEIIRGETSLYLISFSFGLAPGAFLPENSNPP